MAKMQRNATMKNVPLNTFKSELVQLYLFRNTVTLLYK